MRRPSRCELAHRIDYSRTFACDPVQSMLLEVALTLNYSYVVNILLKLAKIKQEFFLLFESIPIH